MKKLEKLSVYCLPVILLLFVTLSSYGQSREEKTKAIIKELKLAEPHKLNYEYRLKPLMYHATGSDSVKLVELEKQFTDENITKVISGAFDEVLTDKEINDIYNFLQSETYKKLFNKGVLFTAISDQFKYIDHEIDSIANNVREAMEKPVSTFNPIPVDREDGFYATVDYKESTEEKNIQLEEKPLLTSKDILEVKKNQNDGMPSEITIQFTKEGAQKFYLITKNNIRKPLAIVLGKRIVAMPTINSPIMGGKVNITGNFTEEEIDEMIERLKLGE